MKKIAKRLRKLALAMALILVSNVGFSKGVYATLEKVDASKWTLSYKASKPIGRLAFRRNPDNSRIQRWKPIDDAFQIIFQDTQEFIVRKDGEKFDQVSLLLTPSHKRYEKDYAPFSPFTDGGTLIYSGRFFACENMCDDASNGWEFTLLVPAGEHIILNGELIDSQAKWLSSNSGEKIYVGRQEPIRTNGFVAVIDKNLPSEINNAFNSYIPSLTDYFRSRLGDVPDDIKPSLYVSYSRTKGPSVRGGVLPNQIFVHLDQDDIEKLDSDEDFLNDLLWTFSHEVAHYFQQAGKLNIEQSESWIHEGHAEMLAFDALQNLYPSKSKYRQTKLDGFKRKCAASLQSTSLQDAASNGNFNAYYTCGFLIYQSISNSYDKEADRTSSPYTTWKQFGSNAGSASVSSKESFIDLIAKLRDAAMAKKIKQFISQKHSDPAMAIETLIGH